LSSNDNDGPAPRVPQHKGTDSLPVVQILQGILLSFKIFGLSKLVVKASEKKYTSSLQWDREER
jgi:hypothetical protein